MEEITLAMLISTSSSQDQLLEICQFLFKLFYFIIINIIMSWCVCACVCTCHSLHMEVTEQLSGVNAPFPAWDLGIKLRSQGLQHKHLYFPSQTLTPFLHFSVNPTKKPAQGCFLGDSQRLPSQEADGTSELCPNGWPKSCALTSCRLVVCLSSRGLLDC